MLILSTNLTSGTVIFSHQTQKMCHISGKSGTVCNVQFKIDICNLVLYQKALQNASFFLFILFQGFYFWFYYYLLSVLESVIFTGVKRNHGRWSVREYVQDVHSNGRQCNITDSKTLRDTSICTSDRSFYKLCNRRFLCLRCRMPTRRAGGRFLFR